MRYTFRNFKPWDYLLLIPIIPLILLCFPMILAWKVAAYIESKSPRNNSYLLNLVLPIVWLFTGFGINMVYWGYLLTLTPPSPK